MDVPVQREQQVRKASGWKLQSPYAEDPLSPMDRLQLGYQQPFYFAVQLLYSQLCIAIQVYTILNLQDKFKSSSKDPCKYRVVVVCSILQKLWRQSTLTALMDLS